MLLVGGLLGSDFAVPEATVEYLITVSNAWNAPPNYDNVIITEALSTEIELVVTDFGGPGSGPIQYQDGSPASGLTCVFSGFSNTTDCHSFSTDGTNFNHMPGDSGDGTNPVVAPDRAAPNGYVAPDTGSGATGFALRFTGKIE